MSGTDTPHSDILRNLEKHDGAAGHAGVMRSGSLIIKPCTQAEIEFYAEAYQSQPAFATWMPTYMGQLTLNKPGTPLEGGGGSGVVGGLGLESERFEQAVVLENLEWGFRRPSVLDIKLGKVLTDEKASEEKRLRLEKVSMGTTSWDNHIRLAGMRVSSSFIGSTDERYGIQQTENIQFIPKHTDELSQQQPSQKASQISSPH
jgi:1D-myo-inositol-tetrakisphosphate 5-kinase/inositol-polyphosphate multikinase